MGIDQTVPIMDDISTDAAITAGVTRAVLKAWVRDHRMVRPLPDPTSVQTSPELMLKRSLGQVRRLCWPLGQARLGRVQ
ncbi:hypothetical protein JCGZ_22306 [Jatropha curcas]|uniref:Uncharacterized protein n=1 Tax=Jatropha curcas TaxID=180498 RepID=A0A067JQY4_JATCU|nr:hypothetical protein JCGZ_22306 [Jatropha curcas]